MRLLNRTAKNKYNKVNCSSLCHDMLIDTSWYRNFMSVNKNSWPHAGLREECLHVDIVGSNLPCFGRPVFYLFGHSVRFSAVRFSIYSAVWIGPYGQVGNFCCCHRFVSPRHLLTRNSNTPSSVDVMEQEDEMGWNSTANKTYFFIKTIF